MKFFNKYSYTILLAITCVIALPFVIRDITNNGNAENTDTEVINELPDDTQISADITEPSTNSEEATTSEEEPTTESETNTSEEESTRPPESTSVPDNDTTNYEFTTVDEDYFNDALFIGDSRTIGLSEYGVLGDAIFFAHNGLSVYEVFSTTVSVADLGETTLTSLLDQKDFGKIYIMLGINELGYNFDNTIQEYQAMVKSIQDQEPNSIIYIQANLYVTKSRSDSDDIYNNSNIRKFNEAIGQMADNQNIFYIDVNEIFDDGNGNLKDEYTSDNTHVLGKYYASWSDWIKTKGIVKE